jgi:hypothetical protein
MWVFIIAVVFALIYSEYRDDKRRRDEEDMQSRWASR